MPYQNPYNENIAHTIHQINQRKVDFENLNNDNKEGSGKIALKREDRKKYTKEGG